MRTLEGYIVPVTFICIPPPFFFPLGNEFLCRGAVVLSSPSTDLFVARPSDTAGHCFPPPPFFSVFILLLLWCVFITTTVLPPSFFPALATARVWGGLSHNSQLSGPQNPTFAFLFDSTVANISPTLATLSPTCCSDCVPLSPPVQAACSLDRYVPPTESPQHCLSLISASPPDVPFVHPRMSSAFFLFWPFFCTVIKGPHPEIGQVKPKPKAVVDHPPVRLRFKPLKT